MATITAAAGGGNWSATTTWIGGVVPTLADDVLLTSASGNVTIDGTAGTPNVCNNFDCTGYTGVLTRNSAAVHNVYGSFTQSTTMTVSSVGQNETIYFLGTGSFTITTGGKNMPATNFNSAGGAWTLQDGWGSTNTSTTLTLLAGTLDTNSKNIASVFTCSGSAACTLTLGATVWSVNGTGRSWSITNTNLTLNAGTSTLSFGTTASTTFNGAGKTFNIVTQLNSGTLAITGNNTIATLNYSSSAACTIGGNNTITTLNFSGTNNVVFSGANTITTVNSTSSGTLSFSGASVITTWNHSYGTAALTVNPTISTFTLNGIAGQLCFVTLAGNVSVGTLNATGFGPGARPIITSTVRGTQRTLTATAIGTVTNVDFEDIAAAGALAADFSANVVGDCGGNSGMIFPTPKTTRWNFGNGNTSAPTQWTNGIPLPQDTAQFTNASFPASGKAVTFDMRRIGTIDCSGMTTSGGAVNIGNYVYGSIIRGAATSFSNSNGWTWYGNRGAITSGNNVGSPVYCGNGQVNVDLLGGTVTQLDDFSSSKAAASMFVMTSGTWDCNGFNFTMAGGMVQNGGTFYARSSVFTFSGNFGYSNGTAAAKTLDMGSSSWAFNGNGTIWDVSAGTGYTLVPGTSRMMFTDVSVTAKVVRIGAYTYGDMTIYGAAGAASFGFGGSAMGTINSLTLQPGANVNLLGGASLTLTVPPAWIGTAALPITVSSTNTSQVTLFSPNGYGVCDYLNLAYNHAAGVVPFYAGSHSNDNGNNANWVFTDDPSVVVPALGNGTLYRRRRR